MQVTVQGKKDLIDLDHDQSLEKAIQQINQEMRSYGYRVGTFELDGQEAWPEWQDQIGDEPISEFDQLDVELVSPRTLCSETLDELQEHFDELLDYSDEAIEYLQQGEKKEGFTYLQSIMSHFQQYIDTINHIVMVSEIELDEVSVDGTPISDLAHRLRKIVNEAEESIKDEDLVSLSDMIQSELTPLIERFREACPLITEQVQEQWDEPDDLSGVS